MGAWKASSAERDPRGFTLLELLVALAITSTVAAAAFQLQQQSLRSWERSGRLTRAVLLAQEKMVEAQLAGAAQGLTRGVDEESTMWWEVQITDGPGLGVSTVRVRVRGGPQEPPILEVATYVARP
jgi:type II secretion system protein I